VSTRNQKSENSDQGRPDVVLEPAAALLSSAEAEQQNQLRISSSSLSVTDVSDAIFQDTQWIDDDPATWKWDGVFR
jgi:hypothetical protein